MAVTTESKKERLVRLALLRKRPCARRVSTSAINMWLRRNFCVAISMADERLFIDRADAILDFGSIA